MVFCQTSLIEKKEKKNKLKQFQIGFRAVARKPKKKKGSLPRPIQEKGKKRKKIKLTIELALNKFN